MAGPFKKRAVAEFASITQQEEAEPPRKKQLVLQQRLRKPSLVLPPVQPAQSRIDFSGAVKEADVLGCLLHCRDTITAGAVQDDSSSTVHALSGQFLKESGASARAAIIRTLAEFAKLPAANVAFILGEVQSFLKTEKSHAVCSELLLLMRCLLVRAAAPSALHISRPVLAACAAAAKEGVRDSSSSCVRVAALSLAGACAAAVPPAAQRSSAAAAATAASVGDQGAAAGDDLQRLLVEFSSDNDARARRCALESLFQLMRQRSAGELACGGDWPLVYNRASAAMSDDWDEVRVAAVRIVWAFAHMTPETRVHLAGSGEELRVVDDGFAKICNCLNDISWKVRAEAARLMGSLRGVSTRFLEQTLDKKLMSNMRRKESAHERQRDQFQSGEWSSGSRWADDAPKEEVDADAVSLISIGACGAFVHGLEDEFYEVRTAAVDSLCELACNSPSFARLAQDFLVDMFNDEIESVRLNAICSLRKFMQHLLLRDDQLEVITNVLKDFNVEIREAAHEMLAECRIATQTGVRDCVLALLDNLKRYPTDRLSVWRTMRSIGSNHAPLIQHLVTELLCLHPYFDTTEPNMSDPAYIAVLIMVLNAAGKQETILALLQEYNLRHYDYLRTKMPELVPPVKKAAARTSLFEDTSSLAARFGGVAAAAVPVPAPLATSTSQRPGGALITADVQRRLREELSRRGSATTHVHLLALLKRDLDHVVATQQAGAAGSAAAAAECLALYIQCLMSIEKICSGAAAVGDGHRCALAKKVIRLTHEIEERFLGLGSRVIGAVHQLRVAAHALRLGAVAEGAGLATAADLECYAAAVNASAAATRLVAVGGQCADSATGCGGGGSLAPSVAADLPFLAAAWTDLPRLRGSDWSVLAGYPQLIQDGMAAASYCIDVQPHLRAASCVIHEPYSQPDAPKKFTAGLVVSLAVRASLTNVCSMRNLFIQMKFPDDHTLLIPVKNEDVRKLGPYACSLNTNVTLSHKLWSESIVVEMAICRRSPACHQTCSSDDCSGGQLVPLGASHKIYLATKPPKKL